LRAAAVFKLCPESPQSDKPGKKIGRKCDLATALLPKGDTRATNAITEYHNGRVLQMISFEVA
jgi:hypothetical protein